MDIDMVAVGQRIRLAREAAGITQGEAGDAIGASQPTYHRIEAGTRPLKGAELIQLADLFGVRAATLTGLPRVEQRARYAARTNGDESSMQSMREKLYAYLELDAYLSGHGVEAAPR